MTEGELPITTTGRINIVMELLGGQDVYDDDGNKTGEKTPRLITIEQARELLSLGEK